MHAVPIGTRIVHVDLALQRNTFYYSDVDSFEVSASNY